MKLKLSVPENLQEITLGQYQKWTKIINVESNKDTYFARQKAIEIFCGVPLKFVATMKHSDVQSIYDLLMKMLDQQQTEMQRIFKFKGTRFGFIPNFEAMSSGEYFDLGTINDWETMHRAMAVLFRPVEATHKPFFSKIEQYTIEKYEGSDKYGGIMKDLPLNQALAAIFFLINSIRILSNDLNISLMLTLAQDLPQQQKAHLQKTMDGFILFTNSLDLMSRSLSKLQAPTFLSV